MKLIVGLGNPGAQYEKTRHNLGFWVTDALVTKLGATPLKTPKTKGVLYSAGTGEEKLLILKPETYMNLSGEAILPVLQPYKLKPEDVWVIADDLNIGVGTLRIRQGGSDGGHNGLKSIIATIGENFWRYRVGIGPQPEQMPAERFVLEKMSATEIASLRTCAEKTAEKILTDLAGTPTTETVNF